MFHEAMFLPVFLAVLQSVLPSYGHPVSDTAIKLNVSTVLGSGQHGDPRRVVCSLEASLTSMEKVTALTLFAARPYGKVGEFDPMATIDLWGSGPELLSGVQESDVDIYGRIGTGDNTRSQLTFSWRVPRNGQIRQYKCVANGLDSSGRVLTVSISSDAATPSEHSNCKPNVTSDKENLSLLTLTVTQAVSGAVANSTAELEASVENVSSDVAVLKRTVDSLERLVKAHNSTVANLQGQITAFTELYQFTYLMSNFDASEVFQGKQYYVSKTEAPFNIRAADTLCVKLGGYLVEIDDREEFYFVLAFVKRVGDSNNFFTGVNDIEEEGVWRFWHSKKRATYLEWGPGQPDNGANNEDCVEIRVSLSGYNHWVCHSAAKFVCETESYV